MRHYQAAAGSTHQYHPTPHPILKQAHDSDIHNRMCGWAFVVAGEKGQRADESIKWWWCDTDMDWQARINGGMVICPGTGGSQHPPERLHVQCAGTGRADWSRCGGLCDQVGSEALVIGYGCCVGSWDKF